MSRVSPHPGPACPRCGYNLTALDGGRACPECGQADAVASALAWSNGTYRPWLHRFAIVLVCATFLLLITGGNVTSRNAGLSVPDWPTSYGYNMFTFPVSMWVANIGHEHVHRLKGTVVGMLSIGMALWLWRTQAHRPWLRRLGVTLLSLVCFQGLMGGLRVTEMSINLAVLHGIHGQLVFCVTVLVAAATSRYWITRNSVPRATDAAATAAYAPTKIVSRLASPRTLTAALLVVLLIQLALGAAMRHHQAGLAIPDFPTAYGRLVPPLDQASIDAAVNAHHVATGDHYNESHFNAAQVGVHFAHRVWAVAVLLMSGWTIAVCASVLRDEPLVRRPLIALALMLAFQVALGASVIWTQRASDVATAHQALGAAILATATLLAIRVRLFDRSGARISAHARGADGRLALGGSPA